ncbi:uncharacterized protein [Zea mays]|uniref:uncharacterized protein isoform X1 n=1 Tax=Zea mays TaxID=4577 RepID=UPI0009AAE4A4|nr:uncharacterized protein LOC103655573 isoform X1 [Zea mays]|eukprot:XP_020407472.1 uncharacterized protein LOC103655573 isoform X1 [Zea mays]
MSNNINGENQLDGADEVKEVKRRGKTKLINVWNIPRGHRVVVNCNELNQPIGEEAGVLAKFLGMVARNGSLCSLSFKDWRLLIGKKDRNHKQINKEAILNQVKKRFLYPARMETWVLRTIGERWRQHKSNLKSIYFDPHKSQDANNSNAPDGVLADQWVALVNNWMTPKAQDLSEANRINCTRRKSMHTSGTKSFARNREELGYPDAPLSPPTDVRPAMKRQGYLDAPLSPPTDVRPAMKRQRIYCQLRSEDSSMFGERNNTMEDENEDDEYEEQHSHYKCSKIQDKSKPPQSRREALHASRVSASIKVSTDIFLKSTRYPNRKVALGRVLSQDPKTKVGDVALGKEFWMVRVSLVSVRDEPLIRPYNNFKVLGQVGNNPIAWPSSCIEKVN